MADYGHRYTDRKIKQLERRINEEYEKAIDEVEEMTRDYFRRFESKDKKWRSWVKQGVKTEKEYQDWRFGQMCVGERWEALKDSIAEDYHKANDLAKEYSRDMQMNVYAENYNWGTFDVETQAGLDTNFTLYDKDTVMRILRDDPDILPQPGKRTSSRIAAGLDVMWNRQIVQSVVVQGILQGLSIPKLATKLADNVGEKNRKAAIRNARTMMTGAQNAGRVESYKRAQRMGIDLKQEWVATLDGRTRHEHRLLDGQRVNVGEPFEVEGMTIRFPGDPQAAPRLVYNCRCTLISQLKGFEIDIQRYRQDPDLDGMTYNEWKHAKESKSNPITLPEEKAENIKKSYIRRYMSNFEGEDELDNALADAYESHRIKNNLEKTPFEKGLNLTGIDLNDLSEESAQAISKTLTGLMAEYDTPLQNVRVAKARDEIEYFKNNPKAYATTYHDYDIDSATILINQNKCGNADDLRNALLANRQSHQCINFIDGKEDEYIATHEFAHSLFNIGEKIDDIESSANWAHVDFDKLRTVRNEVNDVWEDYRREVAIAENAWREAVIKATDTFDEKDWNNANILEEVYNSVCISKYSMKDADEFMAEAFTASRIGQDQNEYVIRIREIIDNYYRRQ